MADINDALAIVNEIKAKRQKHIDISNNALVERVKLEIPLNFHENITLRKGRIFIEIKKLHTIEVVDRGDSSLGFYLIDIRGDRLPCTDTKFEDTLMRLLG